MYSNRGEVLNQVNSELHGKDKSYYYGGAYDDLNYLSGDYSGSHIMAKVLRSIQSHMKYDLFKRNCAVMCCTLLLYGIRIRGEEDTALYREIKAIREEEFYPLFMDTRLRYRKFFE